MSIEPFYSNLKIKILNDNINKTGNSYLNLLFFKNVYLVYHVATVQL